MAKRECIVGVRFDEQELDFLKKRALQEKKYCFRNGSANLPGYIRSCILEQSGWKRETYAKEVKELTYQIRKVGVNINQVTAKINSGYRERDDVRILQENQNQIEQRLKDLLKKLEEEHGRNKTDAYQAGEEGWGKTSV